MDAREREGLLPGNVKVRSGVVAAANFLLLPCLVLSGCMLRARWSLQARHAERRAARAARKRQGASFAALPLVGSISNLSLIL